MKDETLIIVAVLAVAAFYLYNKSKSGGGIPVAVTPVNSSTGATGAQLGGDAGNLINDIEGLFGGGN